MKIRNKFIIFTITIGVLATIGSLYLGFTNLKSVDGLFKSQQQEKETLFDSLNKLKSASLLSYAYDYSYWDDMVSLAQKGNTTGFAKQNIDPSLATYQANVAWVYNQNFSLVYSVNDFSEDKLKEFPLPTEDLRQAFSNNFFPHFYIKTGSDIIEVAGAPIQPSADIERKTTALGYFLVARVWDEAYFQEFSDLMGGIVEPGSANTEESFTPINKQKGIVTFQRNLTGFDGKNVARFHVEINTPEIGVLYQTTTVQLYYLTLISFAAVGVSLAMLYLITIRPINLISKSLNREEVKWLEKIQDSNDEFGQVARLIIKFFEQKNSLKKEVADRFRAEKELEKQKDELERINKTMIDRELKMVELKRKIAALESGQKSKE